VSWSTPVAWRVLAAVMTERATVAQRPPFYPVPSYAMTSPRPARTPQGPGLGLRGEAEPETTTGPWSALVPGPERAAGSPGRAGRLSERLARDGSSSSAKTVTMRLSASTPSSYLAHRDPQHTAHRSSPTGADAPNLPLTCWLLLIEQRGRPTLGCHDSNEGPAGRIRRHRPHQGARRTARRYDARRPRRPRDQGRDTRHRRRHPRLGPALRRSRTGRRWDTQERESTYFLSCNRNKESIAVDLKSDDGQQVLTKLVGHADVLLENFRPGVLNRLGLSAEHLQELTRAW
jgi:hypothetical protein